MEEKLALLHLLSWSEWKHEYKINAKLFEGFLLLVSFKQTLWIPSPAKKTFWNWPDHDL